MEGIEKNLFSCFITKGIDDAISSMWNIAALFRSKSKDVTTICCKRRISKYFLHLLPTAHLCHLIMSKKSISPQIPWKDSLFLSLDTYPIASSKDKPSKQFIHFFGFLDIFSAAAAAAANAVDNTIQRVHFSPFQRSVLWPIPSVMRPNTPLSPIFEISFGLIPWTQKRGRLTSQLQRSALLSFPWARCNLTSSFFLFLSF